MLRHGRSRCPALYHVVNLFASVAGVVIMEGFFAGFFAATGFRLMMSLFLNSTAAPDKENSMTLEGDTPKLSKEFFERGVYEV